MGKRRYKSGVIREQASLLPARVEDYVSAGNPVRAIEAYVCKLDVAKLGFRHAGFRSERGQPAYDPSDLLKLYLYGYLSRIRSSRSLEREAGRNLELIWLLKGLRPGYRTIGNFRKDNWAALKAANRQFVMIVRELGLVGGEVVAIDGSFFHGDASKASIVTRKKLEERLAAIDRAFETYGEALDVNDAAEASGPPGGGESGGDVAGRVEALMAKRAALAAELGGLERSGETQLSRTDPDARRLAKNGQLVAGYNVQVAIDEKHKLIVASEVVNAGNDTGQLHAMAEAAKTALAAETLTVVADSGYHNGEDLKACEADGIEAWVPEPDRSGRLAGKGRFSLPDFAYLPETDAYRCPGGALLAPMRSWKTAASGKRYRRYASRQADCRACPLRGRCLGAKAKRREIERWEHEDVLVRHRERMQGEAARALMRRRAALAEHPFGTLKCRAGYRHFLVRGFDKVRGEWSLMALCYNLSRALNILGFDRFLACLAAIRAAGPLCRRLVALAAPFRRLAGALRAAIAVTDPRRPQAVA